MERRYRSIDPKENKFRFYTMYIEKSLFGEFMLTCTWGRMGTQGQTRITPFNTIEDCVKEMKKIDKTRKRHGYVEVK